MREIDAERAARLEAYRRGALDAAAQRAFEEELLRDGDLARALYEEEGLDAALRAVGGPRRRRLPPRRLWMPLAAAAVLLAVVVPLFGPGGPRGPAPTFRGSGSDLVALAPRGAVDPGRVLFRWTSLEGARRYRLEVFDAASRRLHLEVVPDTLAAVDTVLLADAGLQEGFWRVTALGEVGAELAVSAPAPLRLPSQ